MLVLIKQNLEMDKFTEEELIYVTDFIDNTIRLGVEYVQNLSRRQNECSSSSSNYHQKILEEFSSASYKKVCHFVQQIIDQSIQSIENEVHECNDGHKIKSTVRHLGDDSESTNYSKDLDEIVKKDAALTKRGATFSEEIFHVTETSTSTGPFSLKRCFGLNLSTPAFRVGSSKILYSSSHFGIIWNYDVNAMEYLIGHNNRITAICTNGKYLAMADVGDKSLITLWNIKKSELIDCWEDPMGNGIHLLEINKHGSHVTGVSAAQYPKITRWSTKKGPIASATLPQHGKPLHLLIQEDDIDFCVITYWKKILICFTHLKDRTFLIKETATVKTKFRVSSFCQSAYVSQTRHILTGCTLGQVIVWSREGAFIQILQLHHAKLTSLKEIDGTICFTYDDGSIWFYDSKIQLLHWFTQDLGPVISISYTKTEVGSIPDFIFSTSNGHVVSGSQSGRQQCLIGKYPVHIRCAGCDPKRPFLIIGDANGRLFLYNIATALMELSRNITPSPISALKVAPNGRALVIGTDFGEISIVDPLQLTVIETLPPAKTAAGTFEFSKNSKYLAYYHKSMGVALYRWSVAWSFRGKVQVHDEPIVGITFGSNNSLFTVGKDAVLAEYDIKHNLEVTWQSKIEETAIPTALVYHQNYLLLANDQNKLRMISADSKEIIRTVHVPGSYPITHMKIFNHKLLYAAHNYIGACDLYNQKWSQLLLAHPEGIISLEECDSRIFTSDNNSVFMWTLNQPLQSMNEITLPDYVEAGIEKIFEAGPIRHSEIANCLRAIGFFPTKFEIDNILREIDEPDVSEEEFRKIYHNHKTDIGLRHLRNALLNVSDLTRSQGPVISTGKLIAMLQTGIDPMTRNEAITCLNTLMGSKPIPPQIPLFQFVTQVLGIDSSSIDDMDIFYRK